jgi:hypothetical protein
VLGGENVNIALQSLPLKLQIVHFANTSTKNILNIIASLIQESIQFFVKKSTLIRMIMTMPPEVAIPQEFDNSLKVSELASGNGF